MLSFSTGHWKMLLDQFPICTQNTAKKVYTKQEKDAARLAAASYYQKSPDYTDVVKEYCRLANKEYSQGMQELLWQEILAILPPYRYPASTAWCIFTAEAGSCRGAGYTHPHFLQNLQGVVGDDLFQSINEYVQIAEGNKLRLTKLEEENDTYKSIFDKISEINKKSYDRPDKKYAYLARIIGLSIGVRRKVVADCDLYIDYLIFVREGGQERIEALESVIRKHGLGGTVEALAKRLNEYRTKVIYAFYDKKYPTLSKKIRAIMKGFIPSRDYVKQFQ